MPLFGLFGPPNVEKLKAEEDVKGLMSALGYQKDWRARRKAARALGKLGDTQAVKPLMDAIDNEGGYPEDEYYSQDYHKFVREEILKALGNIQDTQGIKPLIIYAVKGRRNLYTGVDEAKAAIESLKEIGAPAVKEFISVFMETVHYEDLENHEYSYIHKNYYEATLALGKIGTPVIEPLFAVLKDPRANKYQRRKAISGLDMVGREAGETAVDALAPYLKDENTLVRAAAAKALAKCGDKRSVESVIQYFKNKNDDTCIKLPILVREFRDEWREEFEEIYRELLGRLELPKDSITKEVTLGSFRNVEQVIEKLRKMIPAIQRTLKDEQVSAIFEVTGLWNSLDTRWEKSLQHGTLDEMLAAIRQALGKQKTRDDFKEFRLAKHIYDGTVRVEFHIHKDMDEAIRFGVGTGSLHSVFHIWKTDKHMYYCFD